MAFMTMFHATNAGVNTGIIITFWSVNPLFMAVMDYLLFGTKLAYYHLIGTFCIIVCTIVVNLKDVFESPTIDTSVVHKTPIWVPVLYGLLTPLCFTASGMLTKHCCNEKIGFKPQRLAFQSCLIVNVIIIIVGSFYWTKIGFNKELMVDGIAGSIINTLGISTIQIALSLGPAGPVSAIASFSNLFLVFVEAIRKKQMISLLDIIALAFGLYGGFILVIPSFFERFCFRPCIKRRNAERY